MLEAQSFLDYTKGKDPARSNVTNKREDKEALRDETNLKRRISWKEALLLEDNSYKSVFF